jgi:hypothetical protein
MDLNSRVQIVDVDTKEELLNYFDGISELFIDSFGKPLSKDLWEWAYQLNPAGEPLVSMALCENKVVGHYAVIPLNLVNGTQGVDGFLSMTTMVAPDFRMLKLFQILAERVYTRIESCGRPSIVFGFPNSNSAPGFVKRLGWTLLEDCSVVKIKKHQIERVKKVLQHEREAGGYRVDLRSDSVSRWRQTKPNQSWVLSGGVGIKNSSFGKDLMYVDDVDDLAEFIGDSDFNVILPVNVDEEFEVSFPYKFGFRAFNTNLAPKFIVEMAMSDIF